MKDWIKELILGFVLLGVTVAIGYKTYCIAKLIAAKLGISVIKILAFPVLELITIFLFLLALLILWIAIEDKKLEKELEALEKELEEIEKELKEESTAKTTEESKSEKREEEAEKKK